MVRFHGVAGADAQLYHGCRSAWSGKTCLLIWKVFPGRSFCQRGRELRSAACQSVDHSTCYDRQEGLVIVNVSCIRHSVPQVQVDREACLMESCISAILLDLAIAAVQP